MFLFQMTNLMWCLPETVLVLSHGRRGKLSLILADSAVTSGLIFCASLVGVESGIWSWAVKECCGAVPTHGRPCSPSGSPAQTDPAYSPWPECLWVIHFSCLRRQTGLSNSTRGHFKNCISSCAIGFLCHSWRSLSPGMSCCPAALAGQLTRSLCLPLSLIFSKTVCRMGEIITYNYVIIYIYYNMCIYKYIYCRAVQGQCRDTWVHLLLECLEGITEPFQLNWSDYRTGFNHWIVMVEQLY